MEAEEWTLAVETGKAFEEGIEAMVFDNGVDGGVHRRPRVATEVRVAGRRTTAGDFGPRCVAAAV